MDEAKERQRDAEFERLSKELDSAEGQARRDGPIRAALRASDRKHHLLLVRSREAILNRNDVIV